MAVDPSRLETIFQKLKSISDSPTREAIIAEECGDDFELRQAVESLFGLTMTGDAPATVIGRSPDPEPAPVATALPSSELIAGRYALVKKIGEGGMGEVWLANQVEPVKREVALKLIKTGFNSREVLVRFEQERQALAMMDHPNIAKVLDGGVLGNGQPYFVMELVNGLPLNRFCDEKILSLRDRLELFVPVCQAVQHAHQKGVIHRDLKPSNILVTVVDGRPVPKVIDFGVAKATGNKLTEDAMTTQFGMVVGTLEYMSPEQAGGLGGDVDTRSDVYSLGVILYEILTGLRPIDARRLKKAALSEMIRVISEEEPSRPSTRLATDASLPSLAATRKIEPRKLMAALKGELDWIVMKCLEKPRERRYETANGLARDIQRFLADEPVEARPPSAGYRLSKFLSRHRGTVFAACAIVFLLVAGIVGTSWQAYRAETARERAEKNELLAIDSAKKEAIARADETIQKEKALAAEDRANKEAEAAKAAEKRAVAGEKAAKEATQLAKDEAANAQAIGDFFRHDILLQVDARHQATQNTEVKKDITMREALDRAAERIGDRFKGQELIEANIRLSISQAYSSLGEATLALAECEKAYELFSAKLPEDDEKRLDCLSSLASRYADSGESLRSLQLREDVARIWLKKGGPKHANTLDSQYAVGVHKLNIGQIPEAEEIFRNVKKIAEETFGKDSELVAHAQIGLGTCLSRTGRWKDALPILTEVHEWHVRNLSPDHPDVYQTMNTLAECYRHLGRTDESIPLHEKCLKERREKFGAGHPDTIQSLNNLSIAYYEANRKEEAIKLLEEALEILKKRLGEDHISYQSYQSNLLMMYADVGRIDEAIKLAEKTVVFMKAKLGEKDSSVVHYASVYAALLMEKQRYEEAIKALEENLAYWRTFKGEVPDGILFAEARLGTIYFQVGRLDEGVKLVTLTLDRIASTRGKEHQLFRILSSTLGSALFRVKRYEEALPQFLNALEHAPKEVHSDIQSDISLSYERLKNYPKAIEHGRLGVASAVNPEDPRPRTSLALALIRTEQWGEAEELLRKIIKSYENQPKSMKPYEVQTLLGWALVGQNKHAEAETELKEGLAGLLEFIDELPLSYRFMIRETIERLIKVSESLNKPEETEKWKKELESLAEDMK